MFGDSGMLGYISHFVLGASHIAFTSCWILLPPQPPHHIQLKYATVKATQIYAGINELAMVLVVWTPCRAPLVRGTPPEFAGWDLTVDTTSLAAEICSSISS